MERLKDLKDIDFYNKISRFFLYLSLLLMLIAGYFLFVGAITGSIYAIITADLYAVLSLMLIPVAHTFLEIITEKINKVQITHS